MDAILQVTDKTKLPQHVGIIMDGNGRWAQAKGKERVQGHYAGAKRVKPILKLAKRLKIKYLSVYAFSIENWLRPSFEVSFIMNLIKDYLQELRQEMIDEGVFFNFMGRRENLSKAVIKEIELTKEATKNNNTITLNLCINYGGRAELADAFKAMLQNNVKPEDVTEELISKYLYCPEVPDADLIIRTGGDMRVSNFLLWRSAYSELYFTETYWPDFSDEEFCDAVWSFMNRERRFGKTGDQVKKK
ncbi:MAG: di-trans,poly-cis-decaprenylcistransferase [Candidatus Riflebacteria bacterium]|nr:di-trans,poly-cis-decaprenylcistransferase [Candidatus Riflebacteria bacterium]